MAVVAAVALLSSGAGAYAGHLLDDLRQVSVLDDDVSLQAGEPFYVQHAWVLECENGVLVTPQDRIDQYGFALELDGEPLVGERIFGCFDDLGDGQTPGGLVLWRFVFEDGLPPGTYVLTGTWSDDHPEAEFCGPEETCVDEVVVEVVPGQAPMVPPGHGGDRPAPGDPPGGPGVPYPPGPPYPPPASVSLLCLPERAESGEEITCLVGQAPGADSFAVSVNGPAAGAPAQITSDASGEASFRFQVADAATPGDEIAVHVTGGGFDAEAVVHVVRGQQPGSMGGPPGGEGSLAGPALGSGGTIDAVLRADSPRTPMSVLSTLARDAAPMPVGLAPAGLVLALLGAAALITGRRLGRAADSRRR